MADVTVERPESEITLVTMNRPNRLNAMTLETVTEMSATLTAISADPTCRVVVLTGAGRGFCAGHDLADFERELTVPEMLEVQESFAGLTAQVVRLPQPVIAAVNGPAAGGGLALALAADARVCTPSARFNAAFVRLGLSGCDVGVSYLLPRIVGPTTAFEMMLTGRLVDAAEAERVGLVSRVVPEGEVVAEAMAIAHHICGNSPIGVRMTKQVMWANLDAPSLQAAIELENRTQLLCVHTADHREAVSAFVGRREPHFENR